MTGPNGDQMFVLFSAAKASASLPLNFGRIAKPLRGGGGVSNVASPITPVAASSANPLARIQNEEVG